MREEDGTLLGAKRLGLRPRRAPRGFRPASLASLAAAGSPRSLFPLAPHSRRRAGFQDTLKPAHHWAHQAKWIAASGSESGMSGVDEGEERAIFTASKASEAES